MKTYRIRRVPAISFCLLALCACDRHDVPATQPPPLGVAAAPAAPDHSGRLRERAEQAMRDNRLYAPAGDNAVEHFLAARERQPDDARVHAALTELQPYLLIAAEQVLERGEDEQAQRLLRLMAQVDAQAPALPRLRAMLEQMQRTRIAEHANTAADARVSAPAATAANSTLEVDATQPPALAMASVTTLPAPVPEAEIAPAVAATLQAPETAATRPVPVAAVKVAASPRLLQDAQPRYPLPALRGRVEGSVEVAFDIQPDGSVRNARMLSATPEGVFDAAALAVASRWRFEPSGQSHRSQRTVRFRLPD